MPAQEIIMLIILIRLPADQATGSRRFEDQCGSDFPQGLVERFRFRGSLHGFQVADNSMFNDIDQVQADESIVSISA
jgi:hypothetical protein